MGAVLDVRCTAIMADEDEDEDEDVTGRGMAAEDGSADTADAGSDAAGRTGGRDWDEGMAAPDTLRAGVGAAVDDDDDAAAPAAAADGAERGAPAPATAPARGAVLGVCCADGAADGARLMPALDVRAGSGTSDRDMTGTAAAALDAGRAAVVGGSVANGPAVARGVACCA